MLHKAFVIIVVVVAIFVGILSTTLSTDHMIYGLSFAKFFDAMLPVLGVGALLKYLTCCGKNKDNS